jgi:hypothetical protein
MKNRTSIAVWVYEEPTEENALGKAREFISKWLYNAARAGIALVAGLVIVIAVVIAFTNLVSIFPRFTELAN